MGIGAILHEQKGVVAALAIIVIVLSIGSMMKGGGKKTRMDLDRITSMGKFSGEAVASHLGAGKNIALISMDESKVEPMEKQTKAFVAALKDGGISVGAREVLEASHAPVMAMEMGMISGPEMAEMAGRHTDKDAIVSLVGLPYSAGAERWAWPDGAPPLIVGRNAGMSTSARALFDAGVLSMGIFSRMNVDFQQEDPKTHREWFNLYFETITVENLEALQQF